MTNSTRRHGKRIGLALLAGLIWGAATLWAWNTLMAELFGLPQMAMRHVIALFLLGITAGGAVALPIRFTGRDRTE